MSDLFYPDFPCWQAPLRGAPPAPMPDCECDVCRTVRAPKDSEWVPVVLSREPFYGLLKRRSDV